MHAEKKHDYSLFYKTDETKWTEGVKYRGKRMKDVCRHFPNEERYKPFFKSQPNNESGDILRRSAASV